MKTATKPGRRKNARPRVRLTPQQKQDAKDLAYIKSCAGKPTYSWNELMKELGYHDLVITRRSKG